MYGKARLADLTVVEVGCWVYWEFRKLFYFCLTLSILKVKKHSTGHPPTPKKKKPVQLWAAVYLPRMEGFLVRRKPSWNLECQTRSPIYQRRTWYIFLTNNSGFGIRSALSWKWLVSVFALTWCPSAPTCHPSFQRSSALTISWERFERKWKWNS